MQEFLLKHYNVKNYTLKRITAKFLEDYFLFLRTDKNISHNVAKKYIEFVKTIIYPALVYLSLNATIIINYAGLESYLSFFLLFGLGDVSLTMLLYTPSKDLPLC